MRKQLWWLSVGSLLTLGLDSAAKFFATKSLENPVEIFPFLKLQLSHNLNIAFGIPFPQLATILLSFAAILLFLYIYTQQTNQSPLATTAFSLLIGGALGNLGERIVFGQVTDFITLWFIPNFNLADTALTIGIVLLLLGYRKIFPAG
ncbi:MAG: signal peptidase II [Candidatus Gracilibacteria bacterium]|jgi:signal peptidase II|nr:signal peptidase II [Candidatus Gracilibacteria bacterium]MDD5179482.1 signal peptidase II [Candidatus Gracilibacteria bacterium]